MKSLQSGVKILPLECILNNTLENESQHFYVFDNIWVPYYVEPKWYKIVMHINLYKNCTLSPIAIQFISNYEKIWNF